MMEATEIGGKVHHFYGPVVSDLKAVGKRAVEWDLNDWNWDGDLFTAAPTNHNANSVPSTDCRSRQLFPEMPRSYTNTNMSNSFSSGSDEVVAANNEKRKRELEKRRRVVVVENEELNDEAGSLNLKLGGQVYPIVEGEMDKCEGKSGKKTKVDGPSSNRAVCCQVDDCRADLSSAKDYHRRHKVCDFHSKATRALVGNVMQRFCQQCSRFHALQEFDEGKRSCRRRLAGHNRRRRKTHPESVAAGTSPNDEQGSNYLLISLLRILSNMPSNSSEQTKDQDLLSHLVKNLATLAGTSSARNLTVSLPQDHQSSGMCVGTSSEDPPMSIEKCANLPASKVTCEKIFVGNALDGGTQTASATQSASLFSRKESTSGKANPAQGKTKLNNFDLNNAYDDSEECMETLQSLNDLGNRYGPIYQDTHKSSPPQTSGNSASTSTQSPSTSSGETQSRTDRIVFKLFGKDPTDLPLVLRKQILDWLSHSPTEI